MYYPEDKQLCLIQNLKLYLKVNNLTNRDMAALLGVSDATFQNWISGRSMPEGDSQKVLEKFFDAKFDKICSNILTVRLQLDGVTTIEDIFPYNCIIAASFGTHRGVGAMSTYEDDIYDIDNFDMAYRNITPAEFDEIYTKEMTYREQSVLRIRFQEGCSLEDTGKKLGVTRERIRQIEYKALRKIDRAVKQIIDAKHTCESVTALKDENVQLRQYIAALEAVKSTSEVIRPEVLQSSVCLDTCIEDLDLSVRTYNCLKRSQIDTVKDLVNYSKSFSKIRNLGRHSLDEVINTVEKLNIGYVYDTETQHFILNSPTALPEYAVQ